MRELFISLLKLVRFHVLKLPAPGDFGKETLKNGHGTEQLNWRMKMINKYPIQQNSIAKGNILPEPLRVVLVQRLGNQWKVGGVGLHTGQYHERILDEPQIATLQISPIIEPMDGNPDRFRLGIEAYRLALAHEYDPFFSLSIARVDPLPHQLEAVYDYILPLPRIRFLLADDAGAGKTIMAGLLLKELKIRGLAQKTLIITPANLAFQWQREMLDKFRERFEILRGIDLRNAYGTNPWQDKQQIITSMDWAKREEVQDSLQKASWDLVIVDEAHKMSASDSEHKSQRYRLGEVLSKKTDHYLLLTATPHKGDPQNFCLFLQLLDRDVYGDVKSLEDAMERNYAPFYLRRIKEALVTFPNPESGEVKKIFTKREVHTAQFDLDEDEYDFYYDLTRYVEDQSIKAAKDESPRGRALGFIMAMLQRRFASSIYALRRSLERRKEKLEEQLKILRLPPGFDESKLEDLDELPEEEAEKLIEQIEAASLSPDRESIREEIGELDTLITQAKVLEKREIESKLKKLKEVLQDQNIFGNPKTKLLLFTEHRDTLYYLAGNEALGMKGKLQEWGLTVTRIHGGMRIGDRDSKGTRIYAEREFKEESQVLVATEAAGEGINLQFCWLMINYDIPWNPVRLEQRMGRIHRYGQEHDCLIFNFVAHNTREGRVLDKLLERLREIRSALGTDQVFDVVGDIFPANMLERLIRDLYARKTTLQNILDRVVKEVDIERFKRICRSTLEGLAKKELNLSAIVGRSAEAKERRLVPEIVQKFFLEAAPLTGIHPAKGKSESYRIGRVPRTLFPIAERLQGRFGPLGKEYKYVVFDKKELTEDPTLEWVTPGHPLFEVVREDVWDKVQDDLHRGAVFYDLHHKEPYRLDVFAASIKDGRGNTLHRRIFVVETDMNGALTIRQPTLFLDLTAAPQGTKVPDDSDLPAEASAQAGLPDRSQLELCLVEKALTPFLNEVATQRLKETDTISRHIRISLNELINRQNLIFANFMERQQKGEELSGLISQSESRLDELNGRLERRIAGIGKERQMTIGDITHLGCAWVLPHPERTQFSRMIRDDEIERIAMDKAMEYEHSRGWQPEDVSAEDRGFDILSKNPVSGDVRFIEVKGRSTIGEIALTKNEYETALRLKRDYWLYVVFNCASTPELHSVQDPCRLGWKPIVMIDHYHVGADAILKESGQ